MELMMHLHGTNSEAALTDLLSLFSEGFIRQIQTSNSLSLLNNLLKGPIRVICKSDFIC